MTAFRSRPIRLATIVVALATTGACSGPKDTKTSSWSDAGEEGIGIGQTAPDFALQDAKARTVRLADFRGKVVLFEFSAMW